MKILIKFFSIKNSSTPWLRCMVVKRVPQAALLNAKWLTSLQNPASLLLFIHCEQHVTYISCGHSWHYLEKSSFESRSCECLPFGDLRILRNTSSMPTEFLFKDTRVKWVSGDHRWKSRKSTHLFSLGSPDERQRTQKKWNWEFFLFLFLLK